MIPPDCVRVAVGVTVFVGVGVFEYTGVLVGVTVLVGVGVEVPQPQTGLGYNTPFPEIIVIVLTHE